LTSRTYGYVFEDFESLEDYYYTVSDYLGSEVRNFVPKDTFYSVLVEPATRSHLLELLDRAVSKKLNTTFPLGAIVRFAEELSAVRNRLKPGPIRKTVDELATLCSQFWLSPSSGEKRRIEVLWLAGDLVYSENLDHSKVRTLIKCGEDMVASYLSPEAQGRSLSDSDYKKLLNMLNRLESLLLLAELDADESSEG